MSNLTLLTSRTVATRLGVTPRHVSRLVKLDRLKPQLTLPGYRGDHLFTPEEVDRYMSERGTR